MKANKKLSILNITLTSILLILTVIVFFSVISAKIKGRDAKIFGLSFHVVVSQSMEPQIKVGDFVVAKSIKFSDVKLGDYIIYKSPSNIQNGERILHEVITIDYEKGEIKTKGTNNEIEDDYIVTSQHLLGKHIYHSTFMGKLVVWLSQAKNLIFIAVLIFALFIIIDQIKNIINAAKEKKS